MPKLAQPKYTSSTNSARTGTSCQTYTERGMYDVVLYVVHEILENCDEMSPQRHAAAERFLFRTDGKASARLVDAIEEKLD